MTDPVHAEPARDPAWELLERLIEQLHGEIGAVTEPKFADIMRALEMKLKYGDRGRAEREFWKLAAALRREIYGKHFSEKEDVRDDTAATTDAKPDVAVHSDTGPAGRDDGSHGRCPQRARRRRG